MRYYLAWVGLLLWAGCGDNSKTERDTGVPDARVIDAAADAAQLDAAELDSAVIDAALIDAAVIDVAPIDAPPIDVMTDAVIGCNSNAECASFVVSQCQNAVCNLTTHLCEPESKPDTTPCSDSSMCTSGDMCMGGQCQAGTATVCSASDQCHLAGVCNPATGLCSNPSAPDTTPCTDNSMCTTGDRCMNGACEPGTATVCSASDQCHVAGVCSPTTGLCSNPNAPDTTPCSDSSMCTTGDQCMNGACAPGTATVCTASDQCHLAGVCNPGTGICSNPSAPDSSICDDNSMCTAGETCQGGSCTPATTTTCSALDGCHLAGVCNPGTGLCTNPNAPDTTPCTDNSMCTTGDQCMNGACQPGTATVCSASDQCHDAGVCNPGTGLCSNPNAGNGTICNDNNMCTSGETCQTGVCTPGSTRSCPAIDACHIEGICNPTTGACTDVPAPPGTPCTDGSLCTQGETCQAGICTPATTTSCPATDQCHDPGVCIPATGMCTNPLSPDNTPCQDPNRCLTGDTCQGGSCMGGATPVVCTAQDPCHTVGVCVPATGLCTNPARNEGDPCDDSSLCTTGETCQSGSCTTTNFVHCASQAKCTVGVCEPSTGLCQNQNKGNGTACSDGVRCTNGDSCQTGVCTAGPGLCTSIVISQLRLHGPNGGNDEFVELHNNTASPINISSHILRSSNTATPPVVSNRVTIAANSTLAPYGYWLIINNNAGGSYSGTVPGNTTYGTGVVDGGGMAFTTPAAAGMAVIDQVGFSASPTTTFVEGTPLAPITTNIDVAYQRKPNAAFGYSVDTTDNAADLTLITPSAPHNASMSPEINATSDLYFGGLVNQSLSLTVTITNFLPATTVTLGTLIISGPNAAEFMVGVPASPTIAGGGTTTVSVGFSPTTTGEKRATLVITTTNALAEGAPVDLFGNAAP